MTDHKSETTNYLEAVEHLNRVVALMDLVLPPQLSATAGAAVFLLSYREHGTPIRGSIYNYALALENLKND